MSEWKIALLVAIGAAVGSVLLILLVKLWKERRKARAGSYKLKQISMSSSRRGTVPVNAFDWKDHPKLMGEALDKGWTAFGLSLVGASSRMPEISWEIGSGTELMQVIKLNPGLPVTDTSSGLRSLQLLKSGLPIPGPFHGYYSFPQQAYFEVWIGAPPTEGQPDATDFECSKLMGESKSDRIKSNRFMGESRRNSRVSAIGLVAGGSSSFSDVGTVGYYSTGQVVLNGAVYNSDERSKKRPWIQNSSSGNNNNSSCCIVGCGFSPRLRQVFFTLNGEVTCQVSCKSFDEFSYPLHAALASNYEQVVRVNFGQSPFEFLPENTSRVADPSNCRTSSCRTKVAEYDSGDLFSVVGYSQELYRPPPSEAESELFEIVLDRDKAAGANK